MLVDFRREILMSSDIKSKVTLSATLQQLAAATQEYLNKRTLVIHGKAVASASVVTAFQSQIAALQASEKAHDAWMQAVAEQRAAYTATIVPLIAGLKVYVIGMFGPASEQARAFGFQPKARTSSPVAKVIGAEKGRATRKARNILGKKQRLAITGALPATVTVQTAASAPVAGPSAPVATVTVTTTGNGGNGGNGNGGTH
jgi:hypothetical protein